MDQFLFSKPGYFVIEGNQTIVFPNVPATDQMFGSMLMEIHLTGGFYYNHIDKEVVKEKIEEFVISGSEWTDLMRDAFFKIETGHCIFIQRHVLSDLTLEERRAAFLHEAGHVIGNHALRTDITVLEKELEADAYAAKIVGPHILAKSLVKLIKEKIRTEIMLGHHDESADVVASVMATVGSGDFKLRLEALMNMEKGV